jgi:hypothetical protein
MATNDRTDARKTGPVLNYLGHPCKLAELIEDRRDEPDREDLAKHEQRWLTQHLGDQLQDLNKRIGSLQTAIEQVADMVDRGMDHYEIECMLDVVKSYALHTSNLVYETTTTAVVVLDRAGLIAESQQKSAEVANG